MAAVGFGKRITGQILGVKPGTVLSQRKRDGIETQTPPMGSWYRWAMRKAAGKNPDRKRTDCEIAYELHHMDDVKLAHADGFTWVTIWEREAKRRYAKARYDAMTTEEKALKQEIQTRRIKAKMEANPELKAKKAADHKQWREANKDKVKQTQREWVKNNPEKMTAYRKKQMENPAFRALDNQRNRFRKMMKSVRNGGTDSYSKDRVQNQGVL